MYMKFLTNWAIEVSYHPIRRNNWLEFECVHPFMPLVWHSLVFSWSGNQSNCAIHEPPTIRQRRSSAGNCICKALQTIGLQLSSGTDLPNLGIKLLNLRSMQIYVKECTNIPCQLPQSRFYKQMYQEWPELLLTAAIQQVQNEIQPCILHPWRESSQSDRATSEERTDFSCLPFRKASKTRIHRWHPTWT